MRRQCVGRILSSLFLVLLVWLAGMGTVQGQITQNRDTIKIDPSGFPADVQKGYLLFRMKCNACHGLDTSLKPTMSAGQWTFEVKRMQAMASSQFNDTQAKAILDFLNYDEAHRKSLNKPVAQPVPSGTGAAGRQFYDTQGCDTCHAIDGKGGTAGPSLSDVGKRLSKDQLTEVIQKMRTGKSSMPPLPAGTTDQQAKDLIDFLVTLGSEPQKQNADKPKQPETQKESKPADQVAASGTGAAGRQFYDTQGCAKCHAIDGKGGTSGPSLSDVGKRLSKDQLTEVIQKMRTGKSSMPRLPPKTTDQQAESLIDFLVTLSSEQQKQSARKPKQAQTGTNQGSSRSDPLSVEEILKMLGIPTNQAAMLLSGTLLLLIAVTAILIGVLVFRPGLTAAPDGKIMAFFGLFLLPLVCVGMGTTYHIDRSKSTTFCLSCHEMEPFGKSLLADDPTHLPAAHFQNHRVPAGEACFACHTNYAMYGGFREKIQGLKEVSEHYLGNPPAPEAIRLSEPFNNRECLHCHLGARSFEEGAVHTADPYLLPAVKGNKVSCLSSGCHQTVHNIAELNNAKFWQGNP